MGSTDEEAHIVEKIPNFRLLVIGQTSSGKSTLCNRLIGQDGVFPVYSDMEQQTTEVQEKIIDTDEYHLHVVDTPDVFNMGLTPGKAKAAIRTWGSSTNLDPDPEASRPLVLVLLTVRLDSRLTPADRQLCLDYVSVLPPAQRDSLILAFTRLDQLQPEVTKKEMRQQAAVQDLLRLAGHRYVDFTPPPTSSAELQEKVMAHALRIGQTDRSCLAVRIRRLARSFGCEDFTIPPQAWVVIVVFLFGLCYFFLNYY